MLQENPQGAPTWARLASCAGASSIASATPGLTKEDPDEPVRL
jgi:hypothetical protein